MIVEITIGSVISAIFVGMYMGAGSFVTENRSDGSVDERTKNLYRTQENPSLALAEHRDGSSLVYTSKERERLDRNPFPRPYEMRLD
jgi:hypothetical protein